MARHFSSLGLPDPSLDVQRSDLQQWHVNDDLHSTRDGHIHPRGILRSWNRGRVPCGRAAP